MVLRVEQIGVNNLTFAKTAQGDQTTTETLAFNTRARSEDIKASEKITENYRQYDDIVRLVVNYSPNTKQIVDNQAAFSITYRAKSWRIVDVFEHLDRQFVTLTCFRNEPATAV